MIHVTFKSIYGSIIKRECDKVEIRKKGSEKAYIIVQEGKPELTLYQPVWKRKYK